jgi:hypothetical protein
MCIAKKRLEEDKGLVTLEGSIIMSLRTINKKVSSLILPIFSICFVILLAACSDPSGGTGNGIPSLPNDVSGQATVATLKHSPTGTTELSWNPEDQKLTVKISLTGLAPNSSHAAHIHAGTCAADGAVVYPLNTIVANAEGAATSETTIEHVQKGIPASGWYINIHNGLKMTAIEHMPIACGNVTNSNTTTNDKQEVHVVLGGSTAPNESASGKAELATADGKVTLKITLSGLEPNSKHIAHIHAGSCEAQGAVVVMLNPVVADAQGNGTSVTTIDKVPSASKGLYVNVHMGATMDELKQSVFFNPIACGNLPVKY